MQNKMFVNEFFLALISFISVISIIFSHGIPFMPIIFFVYFLIKLKKGEISLKINVYYLFFYFSLFLYFFGVALNQGIIYQNNKNDIMNIIYYLLVILICSPMSVPKFKEYIEIFFKLLALTIPLISLLSLYKFFMLSNGVELTFLSRVHESYPKGTSLVKDYNMFSLGLSIGFVSLTYYYKKAQSLFIKMACVTGTSIVGISIYLSGSRRGIIVLILLILYLLILTVSKDKASSAKKRGYQRIKTIILLAVFGGILFNILNHDLQIYSSQEFERIELRSSSITDLESSFSGRTNRWDYGFELLGDSSFLQLFLGGGFNYLEKYQEKFNTSHEDYPHNFLISAFLYSGILGLLVVLILLLLPMIKLFKHRQDIGYEMMLVYLLILTFLVNSGNSIFSIRFLPIFILIIISVVDKNEGKSNQRKTIPENTLLVSIKR
nr:O-antigen ligase family protein [Lederbergia lenta]